MTKLDKEEKTRVVCPTCGKKLGTWGTQYFNHCKQRHSVTENLDEEEEEPKETDLTENDLEENEKLVKCEKCGEFLITTEEEQFSHCGVNQSVKDSLGDFDEFNGGENEEGEEGTSDPKSPIIKTRAVLPKRKKTGKERKSKKDDKADETREEKEELNKSKAESIEESEPDKEAEIWVCLTCDEIFTDNGYSTALCPNCGEEYARPATIEEVEAI